MITLIATEKRKRHLTAIVLSEPFLCEDVLLDSEGSILLSTEYAEELFLKPQQSFSEEELTEICHESAYRRALSKAMWYLSRRDYCSGEIHKKLLSDYTDNVCDRVVARLQELGLINDVAYARRLAEHYICDKAVSPRQAVYHMVAKGVDINLAREVVLERDDDPREQLRLLVEKKYLKNLETEKGVAKTTAALLRKGYTYGDIKSVLAEFNIMAGEFGE